MAENDSNIQVPTAFSDSGDRIIVISGYAFMVTAVCSFAVIVYLTVKGAGTVPPKYASWLEFLSSQSPAITLLIIAIVAALLGQRLINTPRMSWARTIPKYDVPLVQQAVIDGKPEPIDQYVRLRSLSGWAGNFTKLGITGLPLVTVFLTLVFAGISLLQIAQSPSFLDLTKLTLGAFIGSFVQRQVEHRKQETVQTGTGTTTDLPA